MKKVIVMGILLALVVAGSASANYIWGWNATSPTNTSFGLANNVGVFSPAGNASQAWSVSTSAYAALVVAADPLGAKLATDMRQKEFALAANERTKYIVQVWAAGGYTGNAIDYRVWIAVNSGLPAAKQLTVKCLFDPAGTLTGSVLGIVAPTAGTQAAPAAKFSLPVYKTDTPLLAGNGYVLELSTDGGVIPEPGSMIAMLSGMVGLIGFGIRRKK